MFYVSFIILVECLYVFISLPSQFRFPTIYWAPKNNKSKPRKYEGGREVDDFIKYIKRETSFDSVNVAGASEKKDKKKKGKKTEL